MTASPTPTVALIPLAAIASHPKNPRREVVADAELADSIREQGLLEPVIVAPGSAGKGAGRCPDCDADQDTANDILLEHEDGDELCPGGGQPPADLWVLIAGHRRTAAAALAGLDQVPALLRHDLTGEADQVMAMLVENLQRVDLTPIEEAAAYEQLTLIGVKPVQIAKHTGRSKATIDRRLSLMKLAEPLRERIQAHEVTLAEAEVLVEFAGDTHASKRLESALGTSNWRWTLEQERGRVRRDAAAKKLRRQLVKDGVKIVPALTHEDLRDDDGPRYLENDYRALRINPEDHASCPGHAVEEPKDGEPRYVCLTPAEHPNAEDDDRLSTEERASLTDEQRAREQRRSDIETADGVRREWVRQFTVGGRVLTVEQSDLVYRHLLSRMGSMRATLEPDARQWLAWFDVEVTYPEDASWDAKADLDEAALATQIERRDPAVMLLAVLAQDVDGVGQDFYDQDEEYFDDVIAPFFQFLADLGYELTDWEQAELDAHAAKPEDEDDQEAVGA